MDDNQTQGPPAGMSADEAGKLVAWYQIWNQLMGSRNNPNPFAPQHFYDFPANYRAGVGPDPESKHWSSQYKTPGHPNRFVPIEEGGFWDTLLNQSSPTNPNKRDPLVEILGALLSK